MQVSELLSRLRRRTSDKITVSYGIEYGVVTVKIRGKKIGWLRTQEGQDGALNITSISVIDDENLSRYLEIEAVLAQIPIE